MTFTTRHDFGLWSLERHPNLWSDWAEHPNTWVRDGFYGWCSAYHPEVIVEWRLVQSATQQQTGD